MRNSGATPFKWRRQFIGLTIFLCSAYEPAISQTLTVYTVQNLSFGSFSQGISGGTVIISNTGSRSVTGSVVPLNLNTPYLQAIIEVEAAAGTIVTILNGSDATLTGSNGGTMSMNIGSSDPASPFTTSAVPPARTQVNIGGTLTVGSPTLSPAGTYSGTFYITFNYQ